MKWHSVKVNISWPKNKVEEKNEREQFVPTHKARTAMNCNGMKKLLGESERKVCFDPFLIET